MPGSTMLMELSDAFPSTRLDLGNIINAERSKAGNANVEVLCMAMKSMPLNVDRLQSSRGDAEWVKMQWMVVAVGPPGFSTAPYKSSAKEQSAGSSMYAVDDCGATVFKAWHKVNNNKDRGEVSQDAQHRSRLPAGTFITGFLREENLDAKMMKLKSNCPENKYAYNDSHTNILPMHSFAVIEMKSSHVDNASKGQLLKISKIMPIEQHFVPWNMLKSLPDSLEGAQTTQQWLRGDESLAVQKSLSFWGENDGKKGPCSVHTMSLSKDCFWSREMRPDKAWDFVLVNESNNCSVKFDESKVRRDLNDFEPKNRGAGFVDQDLQKMLDIFSACGAVHVMVQTWATQMPYDDTESIGLGIFIDIRHMLKVDFIMALDDMNDMNTSTTKITNSEYANAFENYAVMFSDGDACILTHKEHDTCIIMSRNCVLKGVSGQDDRLLIFKLAWQEEDGGFWFLDVFACGLDMLHNCLGGDQDNLGLRCSAENSCMILDDSSDTGVEALKLRGISHLFGTRLPKKQLAGITSKKRKRRSYD